MYLYIVFEQFLNQECDLSGSGQASNPMSFQEASKRYRKVREFRDGSESRGSVPVRVGVARLPSNYPGFNDFKGSFEDLCSFRPQVFVICLSKTIGVA
ncbi:MAG: hypothetical protein Q7U66_15280 [Methylobacter sp.]|nr:hypothetical protein [Methylobacter sp.]